jgi:hypothetical protein
VVQVERDADLVQVVGAADPAGGGADLLDGGEEQADQDRDDRDHHQQLDQREAVPAAGRRIRAEAPWELSWPAWTGTGRHGNLGG